MITQIVQPFWSEVPVTESERENALEAELERSSVTNSPDQRTDPGGFQAGERHDQIRSVLK